MNCCTVNADVCYGVRGHDDQGRERHADKRGSAVKFYPLSLFSKMSGFSGTQVGFRDFVLMFI